MSGWLCIGVFSLVTQSWAGDYSDHEEIEQLITAVASQGVSREWARRILDSANRQKSILKAISRPAEKTKPWYEYRKIFLTSERIEAGVEFWREHASVLNHTAERMSVPAETIVAIIGVETFYGRITGNYRVLDALATLAFDYPRRANFFRKELEHFLLLSWESEKDPLALKGSYAGAMGYGQFMPSSYRAYAQSFDNGSSADIWENPADAIMSVANYLRMHGWKMGEPVVIPVRFSGHDLSVFDVNMRPSQSVGSLSGQGFALANRVSEEELVTPIRLEGENGFEHWFGLQNFYVITRYNHSAMYALAVWQLSDAIAQKSLNLAKEKTPGLALSRRYKYIQLGAFQSLVTAQKFSEDLKVEWFYPVNVSPFDTDQGRLYRVRMGPFENIALLTKVLAQLSESGLAVQPIP